MSRKRPDSVTVITKWFNEEDFAPFFLSHYGWVDQIVVIMDDRTDDKSWDIAFAHRKTTVIPIHYKQGFSSQQAVDAMNTAADNAKTDWVIALDCDEFILQPGHGIGIRETLSKIKEEVVYVYYWQIYKNKTELPLNITIPIHIARRFGDPDRETGYNALFRKPAITRTGYGIEWEVGHHNFHCADRVRVSSKRFDGAHWNMADVEIAIKRRLRWRKEVLCQQDIDNQWNDNNWHIEEQQLRQLAAEHEDDPQLF